MHPDLLSTPTHCVVLKLCEKSILDLDIPLTRYARHRFLEDDPRLDLITARHVLSHTNGLVPDWRSSDRPLRIAFAPGEKWSYSGEGYYYLQSVVTDLTGHTDPKSANYEAGLRVCATDFGEYMESRLTAPFGMTLSGYVWRNQFAKRRARPHDVKGNPLPYRTSSPVDIARYGAEGGLVTTPSNYARFLMEVTDPKPADEFHLNASSLKEMTTPQVEVTKADEYTISWARLANRPHAARRVLWAWRRESRIPVRLRSLCRRPFRLRRNDQRRQSREAARETRARDIEASPHLKRRRAVSFKEMSELPTPACRRAPHGLALGDEVEHCPSLIG